MGKDICLCHSIFAHVQVSSNTTSIYTCERYISLPVLVSPHWIDRMDKTLETPLCLTQYNLTASTANEHTVYLNRQLCKTVATKTDHYNLHKGICSLPCTRARLSQPNKPFQSPTTLILVYINPVPMVKINIACSILFKTLTTVSTCSPQLSNL